MASSAARPSSWLGDLAALPRTGITPVIRGRPPGQLRLLRLAGGRFRHRPQRLRRGPSRRLGVGPAPAHREYLGCRTAQRATEEQCEAATLARVAAYRTQWRSSPGCRSWLGRTTGSTSRRCAARPPSGPGWRSSGRRGGRARGTSDRALPGTPPSRRVDAGSSRRPPLITTSARRRRRASPPGWLTTSPPGPLHWRGSRRSYAIDAGPVVVRGGSAWPCRPPREQPQGCRLPPAQAGPPVGLRPARPTARPRLVTSTRAAGRGVPAGPADGERPAARLDHCRRTGDTCPPVPQRRAPSPSTLPDAAALGLEKWRLVGRSCSPGPCAAPAAPSLIAGYAGSSDQLDVALARQGVCRPDERDHARLVAAVAGAKLPPTPSRRRGTGRPSGPTAEPSLVSWTGVEPPPPSARRRRPAATDPATRPERPAIGHVPPSSCRSSPGAPISPRSGNQVVVVAGDRLGRTTQIPKILLENRPRAPRPHRAHPAAPDRRPRGGRAARRGLGGRARRRVGYRVRFTGHASRDQRQVMTDGVLLRRDPGPGPAALRHTIVIDGRTSTSLPSTSSFHLKQLLPPPRPQGGHHLGDDRPHRFAAHFPGRRAAGSPCSRSPGVPIPSRSVVSPLVKCPTAPRGGRPDPGGLRAVEALWTEAGGGAAQEPPGATTSLSSSRRARDPRHRRRPRGMRLPQTEVVPLFARLSAAEQHRVFFAAHPGPGASSWRPMLPDLADRPRHPVCRRRRHRADLPVLPAAQGAAPPHRADQPGQRQPAFQSRCGRLADGIAIRLYAEEDFTRTSSPEPRSCAPRWPPSSSR